jgi:hypothetical protein
MATQFYASDQCLLSIVLERGNEEGEDDRAGVVELLHAVDVLSSGWLMPLGVSCMFGYCDPSKYFEDAGSPAQPHLFVRVDPTPAEVTVKPAFTDSVVTRVGTIDESVIRRMVERGLEQTAPVGLVTSLSELWWTAVRARSPIDDVIELAAPLPSSTVSEVIDGARWCLGPTSFGVAGPPAWLRASNSHFATEITLEVYWDLWIGNSAGRAFIDEGIARVLARGSWQCRQVFPRS